jgi:RNA polymerase sigma-70 factor, ECF subfamily
LADRSDEELIIAHHGGDPSAFGDLVRRYAGPLVGYLKNMSGNQEQAEDLFQETFRKVYQQMENLRNKTLFKTWLFSIATNVAIDSLRRQNKGPRMVSLTRYNPNNGDPSDGLKANLPANPAPSSDPVRAVIQEEQKIQVRRAVMTLPLRQRTTLALVYYQGLGYPEAARVLGCSVGTVKTQMFRALKTLAAKLPDTKGGDA